ncbi:MAG: transcription factor [Thaumarchaeota archaeon]|nr:transcription factor [Nitrososphaerota archaeon]
MLERMGVDMKEVEGVEEVVIRTKSRDIVVKDASVAEVTVKGMRMFQVSGEDVEEKVRQAPKFTEEDVLLVVQQAGVSRERAQSALEDADGDLAKAILSLTS